MTTTDEPTQSRQLSGWSLEELLPDAEPQTVKRELDAIEEGVGRFERLRSELESAGTPLTGERLVEILERYETLLERAYRVSAYGSLWFASDTQSDAALTYRNRVQQLLTDAQNRLLFFELWWQQLDDERVAELLDGVEKSSHERAADYAFHLRDIRRFRPHRMDEKREQIVNLKDADGIGAVLTLYSMITNAFEYRLELEGEEPRTLTRDELMTWVHSERPEHREAAYRELYRVYGENAKVLAQMYVHRVRDWYNENIKLRHYGSPIGVRNLANDVPDEAVEALLEVVRENVPIFQRYFELKAGWLGMERLRRYDIYAPLSGSSQTVEYGDAVELVLDSFESFHPEIARHARRVFDEGHIDSEPRKGKKGGAFCATVSPSLTPWVLVNYTGRLRDVATLAHELGHAVHSMLAEDHSLLTQHPSLPLAETASVFGEILLTDRLLAEQTDPSAKRELLATAIDDIYATVARQTYFVLFEKTAHDAVLAGASPEELQKLYFDNLRDQFGDSLSLGEEFRLEWLSIPHIYSTPFYCYAYSFGQLLVLALYRRFQEEGESFKPGYLRLLAHGGAERPEAALAEVGVDVSDRAFWQGGFDVVAGMLAELEAIEVD